MVRVDPAVLVGHVITLEPDFTRAREMVSVLEMRSTSLHRSASSSPCLILRARSNSHRTPRRSSLATLRSCRVSSTLMEFDSLRSSLIGRT